MARSDSSTTTAAALAATIRINLMKSPDPSYYYLPPVPSDLHARIAAALAALPRPDKVHDLAVDDDGKVSFTFHLTREDPATLVRDARKAVQAVAGVREV
jgi:hypothetical protein